MPQRDQTVHSPSSLEPEMAELVAYFTGELGSRARSLEEAADAGCLETLRTLAHQLKGSASGFGFAAIGEAARVVELGLKDAGAGADAVERVRGELDALIGLCRRHARLV